MGVYKNVDVRSHNHVNVKLTMYTRMHMTTYTIQWCHVSVVKIDVNVAWYDVDVDVYNNVDVQTQNDVDVNLTMYTCMHMTTYTN